MSNSWVLLGCLLLGLAGPAQSDETSEPDARLLACQQALACKTHLDRATELYKQERYSAAMEEYQAAYTLQPYPPILYNIARLQHKQNQLAEAIAYYQRYLDTTHPEKRERAKRLLAEAQQELVLRQAKPAPAPLLLVPPSTLRLPVAPVARHPSLRLYQKWWVWALVGVAATGAAAAIGLGVYASGPDISGLPTKAATLGH